MESYKGKYLRTYFWSGISMILNFFSMFIVAPLTTSMPEVYGIYSLCISFNIFLQYADLGFLDAGRKYAAEAYAVNNVEKEKKYVGTSMSIYVCMTLVLFMFALFFSVNPEYLIKDIQKSEYFDIARQLLFILALTFPLSIIQKFCGLIYMVRIEIYKIQSFQIIGSIVKLASVPLYFFNKKYDIVGYYLFCEFINMIINFLVLWYSKSIGYGMKSIFGCLQFDKQIFDEIKPLAISGFISVIGWVSYYELDTVAISVLLGANAVAIYALGKQIHTFVRSLVSIVFSPYPVRVNYFIGQNDLEGLKSFFYKLAEMFSFVFIPIVVIALYAKPFVIAWVGYEYEESAVIIQLMVLTFILHHVTGLGSSIVYGLNKVRDLLKIAFIQPSIFWIGVLLTYKYLGVESFAIFKLLTCLISEILYCYLVCNYLEYDKKLFYWSLVFKPIVVIAMTCCAIRLFSSPLIESVNKGHRDLLFVIFIMGVCCVGGLLANFVFNKSLRVESVGIMRVVWNHFKNN